MGITDKYDTVSLFPRTTQAKPGWEGNIMGENLDQKGRWTNPDSRNIIEILQSLANIKECVKW